MFARSKSRVSGSGAVPVYAANKTVSVVALLVFLCAGALARIARPIVAIPYVDRRPSWLVLWNNSTGPNGIPKDETWAISFDDRIVSRKQTNKFEVISNEGLDGAFPASGPLILHRHVTANSKPALAVKINWPDDLPESITFQITLKVKDGGLESTSRPHDARLWKAIRSSSSDLPSVTQDSVNHDLLHYNAAWLGGPGPIQTKWKIYQGVDNDLALNGEQVFGELQDPSLTEDFPWLDEYHLLPWFNILDGHHSYEFLDIYGRNRSFELVGLLHLIGSNGTTSLPVSLELLAPLNELLVEIFPDFVQLSNLAFTAQIAADATPLGGLDVSKDLFVSDYVGDLELEPFDGQSGHHSIVIDL
jgi:hypothetical protein